MKLATFTSRGQRYVGTIEPEKQIARSFDLTDSDAAKGVLALLDVQGNLRKLPAGKTFAVADIKLEAPLRAPRRSLFCVGRNYHTHAKELSASVFKNNSQKIDEWPIVFSKMPECVIGPFDNVQIPVGVSEQIDYEAELAVVIGRGGRNIKKADALNHILGYTIVNDVTARDVQIRHQQWDLGKSFDTFCPMGPWVVTKDEVDGADLQVRCWVNGDLRQSSDTSQLIFDIPTLIETCSRGITLYPGDIIATGTPAGVGMGMTPPQYLKSGDVVRVEIGGVGHIENRFV